MADDFDARSPLTQKVRRVGEGHFTATDIRLAGLLGLIVGAFIVMVLNEWWK